MKPRFALLIAAGLMAVVIACTFTYMSPQTLGTAAALTVEALMPSETPVPTATPLPAATQEPTATPRPCSKAKFISETIPDGTVFIPNKSFTKTWRLENIGTCTWNTSYRTVFYSGNQMGGPDAKGFTFLVHPGERMDVVLELKAPSGAGYYSGVWKLQDDMGRNFAQIYVVIEVY